MNGTILALALLSVICTILEIFYENQLEDLSATLISQLQNFDAGGIQGIFLVLEIATAVVFIYVSAIIYFCNNKLLGATGLCVGLLCACFASFLKMCFVHPRPLWKYDFVRPFRCSKDFGFPSGHAFSSAGVIFFLGYHWAKSRKDQKFKVFAMAMAVFIVGLDRTYLGVHFHFQVVAGNVYAGLLVSIIVSTKLANCVKKMFSSKKWLITANFCAAGFMGLAILVYILRNGQIDQEWNKIFKEKCGKELSYDVAMLKHLDECTLIAVILGFALGYFFSLKTPTVGFSGKNIFIATAVASLFAIIYFGFEKLNKYLFPPWAYLTTNFALKYFFSAGMSYFVPVILFRVYEKKGELVNRSDLQQIELNRQ